MPSKHLLLLLFVLACHLTYNTIVLLVGVSWHSALQLAKTIDQGDIIGTGASHQVAQQHLETRQDMFKQLHLNYWPYLPKEEKVIPVLVFSILSLC